MKSNRTMTLFLGLAAICLTAGSLGAADLIGSFTLPSQTYWGSAILPPGSYTFTLGHATPQGLILIRHGTKGVALIMTQSMSSTKLSEASSMQIVGSRVRSLHLGPIGLTYNYPIPKKQEVEMLARGSGVPSASVSVAAK